MIVEVLPFFQQNAIATVYRGFERFHNRFVISTNRGENFEEGDYIYVIFYINDSAYVSEVETVGDCVIEDLTGVILPCLNP